MDNLLTYAEFYSDNIEQILEDLKQEGVPEGDQKIIAESILADQYTSYVMEHRNYNDDPSLLD